MLRAAQYSAGLLSLLVSFPASAQQVASVDLTKTPGSHKVEAALPKGCDGLSSGSVADGYVISQNGQPEIVVEIIRVSNVMPTVGQEVNAVVRLQNSGKEPFQIPWSTDPKTLENGQNPGRLEWEVGSFWVVLNGAFLKSLTFPLYGSESSPASQLRIGPGEWITATIKFKLENEFPAHQAVSTGDAQLSVEWEQAKQTQSFVDCEAMHGNYEYRYKQKNPTVLLRIGESASRAKERDEK